MTRTIQGQCMGNDRVEDHIRPTVATVDRREMEITARDSCWMDTIIGVRRSNGRH